MSENQKKYECNNFLCTKYQRSIMLTEEQIDHALSSPPCPGCGTILKEASGLFNPQLLTE